MNKLKCKSTLQLTLDDDFNVPDAKPDIDKIVKEQGEIRITEVKAMSGKFIVKGVLFFNVLYLSNEGHSPVHNITGEIPFDEVINMESSCADDQAYVKCDLEDLTTGLINSRKMSTRAIIRLNVAVEELYDEETAVSVEGDDVHFINKKIEITDVCINKKDTYRIKDELSLPSNKGNIESILYSDIHLNNVEVRLLDDKFSIKGDIPLFLLYNSDSEGNPVEYYETEVSFNGMIECNGCREDMIEDIGFQIINKSMDIKSDHDGEGRVLDLEIILEMAIKVYKIEEPEILCDIYSPFKEITPIMRDANYENLVIKNNSKYRISDTIRVPEKQPSILQICHANGTIKIDDIYPSGTELLVEGVIEVSILYISEDDRYPMNCMKGMIPFSQVIEVKGMKPSSYYEVKPCIDQLSVMMLDSVEIELKVMISLNTIVFDRITQPIITDVEVTDLDLSRLHAMPGIVGYIVKPEEDLWNIAKKFYTTVDTIMSINNLADARVAEGDKIIIMKTVNLTV